MGDPLRLILRRLELEPAVFFAGEARGTLGRHWQWFCDRDLLREISPVGTCECPQCAMGSLLTIEYVEDSEAARKRGYICCATCGLSEVPLDELRRWAVDLSRFLQLVGTSAGIRGNPTEIIADYLWKLGNLRLCGRPRDVYFGRNAGGDGAHSVPAGMARHPKAIVFVPTEAVAGRWGGAMGNLCVALESVVTLEDSGLRFDVEYVESCLMDAGLADDTVAKRPARKRADRAADIEVLEREVIKVLLAAKDHATSTKDRTGTPELLPRPSQKMLAELAGIPDYRVSRCLKDPNARELKLYWETANDLGQIRRFSAPRHRKRPPS